MKLIIAGTRRFPTGVVSVDDIDEMIRNAVYHASTETGRTPTEIVSGDSGIVDCRGNYWAHVNAVPLKKFPADWDKLGKAAGPIRNLEMARYADVLVAVWDGSSRGTRNMIATMKKLGKPVFEFILGAKPA